jgi:recombination protein RecT
MNAMEKTKQAVATTNPTDIRTLIQQSVEQLGKAMPSHMNPERLVRIALTTMNLNPALYKCDPKSFLGALFQSAQLGLEPNVEGQAYIIPYGNQAQFQIGYKGYVELFFRHESAMSLDMQEVHEKDNFDYEYGTGSFIKHKPALTDRGQVIAYYAVAKLKSGAVLFKVMSKEDCIKHGKQHSKTFNSASSPWQKDQDAMCKKTVLIQLMKLLPKSIEIQRAIAMDETIKTKIAPDMFTVKDDIDFDKDVQEAEAETVKEPETPTKSKKEELLFMIELGVNDIIEKNAPGLGNGQRKELFSKTLKRLTGYPFISDLEKLSDNDLAKIAEAVSAELIK